MSSSPVAPQLFSETPALHLIGGRHRHSQRRVFPLPSDPQYDPIELPDHGTLWSYTIQRFAPKSPPYRGAVPFVPFAVGYIELADALIVESRLIEVDFKTLKVGLPMQLTTHELRRNADGSSVRSFAFRPQVESAR